MNASQPAASDRVFPLSGGSAERPRLRAPRLAAAMPVTPGVVMGNRAFMRAWAARRAGRGAGSLPVPERGQAARATPPGA